MPERIKDQEELEAFILERDGLEGTKRQIGPELRDLELELAPMELERSTIEAKLKRMAWPNMMPADLVPIDAVIEKTRNSVGQVVTTRRFRPRWPKRPPAFVIDREARAPLFARLDELRDKWRETLTRQHDLKAQYRYCCTRIEELEVAIDHYHKHPPKKPKGGRGQLRLV